MSRSPEQAMRIRWSLHAARRLRDRQLSAEDVETAVAEADQRYEDPARTGRWIAHKRVDMLGVPFLLRVFYADAGGSEVVVLSFYRTSQVARYWRTDL